MGGKTRTPPARSFRSDRIAWMVTWLLILAAAGGIFHWQHHRTLPVRRWNGPVSRDPGILVLAFDRIVSEADGLHMTAASVHDLVQVLADEGFQAIALSDLRSFFLEKRPLPRWSLLLTFDHGYMSTFEAVDPLLRSMKLKAAMSVSCSRIDRRNTSFLYWKRLERMVNSGRWELISGGDQAAETVPTAAPGRQGNFLASRRWLPTLGRPENDAEYHRRVHRDLQEAGARIGTELASDAPFAFSAPVGNLARSIKDRQLLAISEEAIRQNYELAFEDDRFGYNDAHTDPYHIARLRLDISWRPGDLRRYVRGLRSLRHSTGAIQAAEHLPWLPGTGALARSDNTYTLEGRPRADMWLPAVGQARCWQMQAQVLVGLGQFWIVQRSSRDSKRLWRVGGTAKALFVQFRNWDVLQTLAAFPVALAPRSWHRLSVTKRGHGVWIRLDGNLLTVTPVYLHGSWQGAIGWVAWNRLGAAKLRIRSLRFGVGTPVFVRIPSSMSRRQVQRLIAHARDITGLVVPGWDMWGCRLKSRRIDADLLALLAKRYAFEVLAALRMDGGGSAGCGQAIRLRRLVRHLAATRPPFCTRVLAETKDPANLQSAVPKPWLHRFGEALAKAGLELQRHPLPGLRICTLQEMGNRSGGSVRIPQAAPVTPTKASAACSM